MLMVYAGNRNEQMCSQIHCQIRDGWQGELLVRQPTSSPLSSECLVSSQDPMLPLLLLVQS